MSVRFAFTDEQRALAGAVREMLDKECSASRLRDAWASADGCDRDRWQALADMGVLGLLVPEGAGGLGLTDVDAVLVWFEIGRAAVPEPVLDTAAVANPLLGEVTGESISVTHALHPFALAADRTLHLDHDGAWFVDVDEPVASVDASRRLWTTRSTTPGNALLHEVGRAVDRAVVAHAAALCGLSQRMLDMTVAYAKERHQFGRPIGSFQAVKHHCADALLALEFAKPLVWRAAWSITQGDPDVARHASMAKARAGEAAVEVAGRALQCHGAIGYTTEYDLHLYMKRAWAWARAWGDADHHYERIGDTTNG